MLFISRTPELVELARDGLRSIVEYERLSKDLLQECLRPVLLNLADFRKISVFLIDTLHRLLDIMSSCFHVTLGEKLIEHLFVITANSHETLTHLPTPPPLQPNQPPPQPTPAQALTTSSPFFVLLNHNFPAQQCKLVRRSPTCLFFF
jgi:hypothetical protein